MYSPRTRAAVARTAVRASANQPEIVSVPRFDEIETQLQRRDTWPVQMSHQYHDEKGDVQNSTDTRAPRPVRTCAQAQEPRRRRPGAPKEESQPPLQPIDLKWYKYRSQLMLNFYVLHLVSYDAYRSASDRIDEGVALFDERMFEARLRQEMMVTEGITVTKCIAGYHDRVVEDILYDEDISRAGRMPFDPNRDCTSDDQSNMLSVKR